MPKYMTAKEFRDEGYVQELNRRFLHPLGLAVEVRVDPNGGVTLGGIWDSREDEEGIWYEFVDFPGNEYFPAKTAEEQQEEFVAKAQHIRELWAVRRRARASAIGYNVQPYADHYAELGSDIVRLYGRALGEVMSQIIPVKATSKDWDKAARTILDRVCEIFADEPYDPQAVRPEEVHLLDLLIGPEAVSGRMTRAEALNQVIDRGNFYKEAFETATKALSCISKGDIPPGVTPQEAADMALSDLAVMMGG